MFSRHIYIPLGGSHNGPMTQIFAILSCFTYIWFWHGAEEFLFIWAGVNFLGLVCEVVGAAFMNSAGVKKFEVGYVVASCHVPHCCSDVRGSSNVT